jgi:hypothetical protein
LSKKRKGKRPRRAAPAASQSTPPPRQAPRVAAPDDRPPAPWGNFPLAELVILGGIVSLAIGVIGGHPTVIGVGVALAGLGGLEVAAREHFAGYRSHTTLLAGAVFVLTVGGLFYLAHEILAVALAAGAITFLITFYLARRAFQRASGGLSFRVGGMRG